MRRFLLIFSLLIATLGAGYYFYLTELKKEAKIEEIVPTDAFLYFQSSTPLEDLKNIENSDFGSYLSGFESTKDKLIQANALAELIPEEFNLKFSAHNISKTDFDLLYYFDDNVSDVIELVSIIVKKEKWNEESRQLDGIHINEYLLDGKSKLSVCELKGWLVISRNPFLIEEVIKNRNKQTSQLIGKWMLFPENFQAFISGYLTQSGSELLIDLGTEAINIDYKFDENRISIIGNSTTSDSVVANKVLTDFFGFTPMNTSLLLQKNDEWNINYKDEKVIFKASVDNALYIDTLLLDGRMYPIYQNEDALGYSFENGVALECTNANILIELINAVNNEEVWGKSLRIKERLDKLSNDADEMLVMDVSNSIGMVMKLIKEDVKESYLANISKFDQLGFLSIQLTKTGNSNLIEASLDFNLDLKGSAEEDIAETEIKSRSLYTHEESIITKPYLVKNHNSGANEFIFQDTLNQLCLIGNDHQLLWNIPINEPIQSTIYQVDAFRNGKLQYLFVTKNAIHLVDRNGDAVDGYPIKMSNPVRHFNLLDYDNNRKYRLITSHNNGDIRLLDITGKELKPWNPIKLTAKSIEKPFHVRVRGKDYIVIITEDNKVHCLNRRAEPYSGFPIQPNIDGISNYRLNADNGRLELFSQNGKSVVLNFRGEITESKQYVSDVIGEYGFALDNAAFVYYVTGEYSTKFYNSGSAEQFEVFGDFSEVQYYNFNKEKQLIFVQSNGIGQVYSSSKLVNELPCSQRIASIYSSAKEELTIYSVNKNELVKSTLDF